MTDPEYRKALGQLAGMVSSSVAALRECYNAESTGATPSPIATNRMMALQALMQTLEFWSQLLLAQAQDPKPPADVSQMCAADYMPTSA